MLAVETGLYAWSRAEEEWRRCWRCEAQPAFVPANDRMTEAECVTDGCGARLQHRSLPDRFALRIHITEVEP